MIVPLKLSVSGAEQLLAILYVLHVKQLVRVSLGS
jgi:hypothetical protein